jgi:FAD/FMN-containing dehydrogenase
VAIKHELINKASDLAQELRAGLQGRVITPDDPEYDPARIVFDGAVDWRPALIARPVNAADVAYIVTLARQHGLELAIRSGGHGGFGHNLSVNGLVLDLREMRALEIDPVEGTAWAETGLTAGEFTQAVGEHGLATGFGDTGSVGIGGITLGGGIGFLVRKYGLTIDSLLAAEVVTADGQLLYTDAGSHPDLFWALCGGGGNFGVATRFKFRLHPVDAIVGGHLVLPAKPEILAAYMAAAEAAPEELSSIANVMPAPPPPFLSAEVHGRLVLWAMMVYAGDQAAGERALAPFRALAEPLADLLRPMRYPEMYEPEEGDYHPTAVARTLFLDRCELDDARTILNYLQASDAGMRVAQLRPLGGAMARVPVEATAFAHRQARIMVSLAAFYEGSEDRYLREAWVADFAAALHQENTGVYANFLGEEGPQRVRAAYPGATWERLAKIKARYDPTNLFRFNHNIPPVSG